MLLLVTGKGKTIGFVCQSTSCHELLGMPKHARQWAHWWFLNGRRPPFGQFYTPMVRIQAHLSAIQWYCINSTSNTRSFGTKLCHRVSNNNTTLNSYFFRLPRLWNSLPIIDISLPFYIIKKKLISFLWNHFISNFDPNNNCTFHFYVLVVNVLNYPTL